MATHLLPELKINVSDSRGDLLSLLKTIKPSWKSESITIEPILGGYSGSMYRCYESDSSDALTVRVRRLAEQITIFKNEKELKTIQLLSENGHFPTIHAIFANGYCYQYIIGKPIINPGSTVSGHMDEMMLRAIARELAYVHRIKLDGVDYSKSSFFTIWDSIYSPLEFQEINDETPSKEAVLDEMKFLGNYLSRKNPRIVTCHGDLHPGNFIWNKDTEKVTFVDWEGAMIGYQLQEIAHFLLAMNKLGELSSNESSDISIPSDYEKKFLRTYLEAWYSTGDESKEITDKEVEKWLEESRVFELVIRLHFITVSLTFPRVVKDFSGDRDKFFERTFNNYLNAKEKHVGKRSFGEEF